MGVLVQLCLGLRTVSTITDLHIILAGALIFFGVDKQSRLYYNLRVRMRIALKYSHEQYISGITRIKGGYLFGFCNKDGDEKIINPVFVNEDTGKAEIYFPPDHGEAAFHENCEVPEEFRPVGIRN